MAKIGLAALLIYAAFEVAMGRLRFGGLQQRLDAFQKERTFLTTLHSGRPTPLEVL